MRKAQKQQINEFLDVLKQAHNEIKRQMGNHHIARAMEVLEQCQQGAVQLGELIESIEGTECVTIRLLEDYCEKVYIFYEELGRNMAIQESDERQLCRVYKSNKICEELGMYFLEIKNSVENDIRIRKEVVFLPYKASMWESLESVWQAADADPDCDAYVIPIPYYDRALDGSFCKMHYEGHLYPKYVPVIRYDEYNFATRKPDMIFIHNPYDEYNYVTSIAPFFYSKNLKKYTEQLIYIPYFILREVDADNPNILSEIENYCTTQGVVNADKVIVQSENMKRAYVNVLTKETGEGTRKYWEDKILGLGSPKIDKVLNTKKSNVELPREWVNVVRKSDGQFKNVVLYNTSVTALLKYEDKQLEKIKDVIHLFKENREKIVLLWRPHPLIKAALESMRPQLLRKYEEIVERYKEDGWGIYDDTADIDRAVALSDAYYGDESSVVQLYEETGKPVTIQNIRLMSKRKSAMSCVEIIRYEDRLYLLTRDSQCLFEYSFISEKMRLCGIVGREYGQVFITATLCKNKIYFAPYTADCICIYDILNEKFKYIDLPQTRRDMENREYNVCFSFRNKVYCLGNRGSAILCIDAECDEVEEITEWIYDFKEQNGYITRTFCYRNVCVADECFWVPLEGDNILMQYNMLTGEHCFWNIGKRKIRYATVSFDGNYFWLSGNEDFLVRWDKEKNEIKEYDKFPMGFKAKYKDIGWKDLFSCGYIWKDSIYFTPLNANMAVRLDLITEDMEEIIKIDDKNICFNIQEINDRELYIEEIDETLLHYQSYIVNTNGKYSVKSFDFESKDDLEVLKEIINKGETIKENHMEYLSILFNVLEEEHVWKSNDLHENIGNKIYRLFDLQDRM